MSKIRSRIEVTTVDGREYHSEWAESTQAEVDNACKHFEDVDELDRVSFATEEGRVFIKGEHIEAILVRIEPVEHHAHA